MKRLSLVILLGLFAGSAAFASNDWTNAVGNWTEAAVWSQGHLPTVDEEVKVRGAEAICTLNTGTGDWGVGQRMRVYEGATLIVEEGAELLGAGWLRVGASNVGTLIQTGGLVRLQVGKDTSKLQIGDSAGSEGSTYTMSGGTLTYLDGDGELTLGYRGGQGTLTVIGTGPTIQMKDLYVGGKSGNLASGTLEFQIDSLGVSPITVDSVNLDPGGDDSTAALVVSLIGAPPAGEILLVDNTGVGAVNGIFDSLNGGSAAEGAPVTLSYGGSDYLYTLTYAGGVGGNDIVLIPEPATLALFSLGSLIAAIRRRPRKK